MARTVTRAVLRTRVRQRADIEGDLHVTDAEINDLINGAVPRIWDILVSCAPPDYYKTDATLTLVAGQIEYDLNTVATDFYKLRRLWQDFGAGRRQELSPLTGDRTWIQGPAGGEVLTMRYIPCAPSFTLDADTFDGVNGWEELIVLEAAIDVLDKQERDPSALMAKRQREETRIRAMAYRDAGSPQTVRRAGRRAPWLEAVSGYQIAGSTLEVFRPNTPYR